MRAEINVKNAIGGKVIGNITATNKIELQSGSHIEGDITTHRLVIDEGVFFEGSCKMGELRSGSGAMSDMSSAVKTTTPALQQPPREKVGAGR